MGMKDVECMMQRPQTQFILVPMHNTISDITAAIFCDYAPKHSLRIRPEVASLFENGGEG